MAKTFIERVRIPLSRVIVLLLFFIILFSESFWEDRYAIVSTALFSIGITLVGIASLGRLWCSLYIAGRKNSQLVVLGPYSVSRNPLYFFSLIGIIGVGLSTETFTFALLSLLLFILYYPFVMREEAKRLRNIYKEKFIEYEKNTPFFWPNWALLREPSSYEVDVKVFRKHIFSALWFIWIVGVLELVEAFHEIGILPVIFRFF